MQTGSRSKRKNIRDFRDRGRANEIMNCKHVKIAGNTTKYYYCKALNKAVDDYKCRDCLLKIPNIPKGFEEVFGKGFRR